MLLYIHFDQIFPSSIQQRHHISTLTGVFRLHGLSFTTEHFIFTRACPQQDWPVRTVVRRTLFLPLRRKGAVTTFPPLREAWSSRQKGARKVPSCSFDPVPATRFQFDGHSCDLWPPNTSWPTPKKPPSLKENNIKMKHTKSHIILKNMNVYALFSSVQEFSFTEIVA